MGCKRKRVEDIRFIQGKGNYVDDLKLPGMLYGDFMRSPHAHARIKNDRRQQGQGGAGRARGAHRRRPEAAQPALHADARRRRAGGARRGEGAVPEPGGRLRHRRRPLHRGRRRRPGRGRIRGAAAATSIRSRRWRRTRRCCARTSRTRPTARTARASTTTTSSPGRWATRTRPTRPSRKADVTIKELISYQRVHPCPLETCQCVASFDKIKGELTVWGTFQAPHVIRTVASLISKIPEHKIHVIAPDIGGGFGNKVGAYPGYICAIVASIVTGRPVKWVEDRIENLSTTAFARDYHMTAEIAATKDGKVTALRVYTHRRPRRLRRLRRPDQVAGRLLQHRARARTISRSRTCTVDGVYTNKAPGGVAYRCSFRVTEAAYCIERAMDIMAQKLGMDPAELRMKNLIRREQFPYTSALGWEYDSGDYHTALHKAMDTVGYQKLRAEQKAKQEAFRRGETRELMGIGVAFFTEIVGAGPSRNCDILGIAHVRLRRDPHPSDRHRHRAARHQVAGPGPRDDLRADHRDRARPARRQHHDRGGQHRHRALRARHLRLALDAGVRRRDRDGGAQDQGQGADDRRASARGARRRPRMGRRPLPGEGQPGALQDHDGARLGRLQQRAARHGARASRR